MHLGITIFRRLLVLFVFVFLAFFPVSVLAVTSSTSGNGSSLTATSSLSLHIHPYNVPLLALCVTGFATDVLKCLGLDCLDGGGSRKPTLTLLDVCMDVIILKFFIVLETRGWWWTLLWS